MPCSRISSRETKRASCFDFTLNDIRIDYMLSQGFQLLICFNFMPRCLAKNPGSCPSWSAKGKTRQLF
jgi:hypothetical protein